MSDIKVNKTIWDQVSVLDKQHITAHLRLFGILEPEENIIADDQTSLPCIDYPLDQITAPHGQELKALGIDWLCRDICNMVKRNKQGSAYECTPATCLSSIADTRKILRNHGK